MFIDSHAHLTDKKFALDLERVLERASDAGIERAIVIGDSVESSRKAVGLAHRFGTLYASAGIHPHNAARAKAADFDAVAELAGDSRVVAIGEVGLDCHYSAGDLETQKTALIRQIGIARDLKMPLIAHCREAFEELGRILKKEKAGRLGGVVHCFSGEAEDARFLVKLGWHVGVAGPVTYERANGLREALDSVPLDRLLIETDSPYLPPQAKRGRRNEPSYLRHTLRALADLKGVTFQDMARITKLNTVRLFGMPAQMPPEIAYSLRRSLYLNITSRCTNNCYFCHRQRDFAWAGHNLHLPEDPSREEILSHLENAERYEEVVFCGVGEPTLRLDVLLDVAQRLKERGLKVRLNTNGQGSLFHQADIVPRLAGLVDAVSISLNAPNAADYEKICRPSEGDKAFDAVIAFAKRAKKAIPKIEFTVVGAPGVDIEACRALAEDKLKIPLRVREFIPPPPSEAGTHVSGV